jgi:hypothetical protein
MLGRGGRPQPATVADHDLQAPLAEPLDGLTYAARLDGEDLFAPFLQILNAGTITD